MTGQSNRDKCEITKKLMYKTYDEIDAIFKEWIENGIHVTGLTI